MDQEKELSREFTFLSLMRFAAPAVFTFVFIGVYQMADGLFIERFVGEMAISAINLYYPIISLFIAVGIMIGSGGNAVIVRLVGEGRRREAGETFSRVITFTVILGILFTLICLIFADPIMRLCGATDGNIGYLRPYYLMLSAFSITILLQSELGILIIGEGRTVVAAVVIMIGGIVNCALDYVFMGVLDLGIKGAALATVIGYCGTIVYAIWFYLIGRKSSYRLEVAKPDMRQIGFICFNGSSDMVSNLAEGITILFMNHLAYRCYGETGVSALAVVTYVQVLITMVFMGYTSAVEPVLSYHCGSGDFGARRRVFRLSLRVICFLGITIAALLFILRGSIVGIFFDEGTQIYDIASLGCLIALPACLFTGFNIFGSGLFTAFGNGVVSGLLSLIRSFAVLTACLYGMTALFGGPGLWAAWPAAEAISAFVTMFALKKYKNRYRY